MKVLFVYYGETGDTEKVAKAICKGVAREYKAHPKRAKEICAETLIATWFFCVRLVAPKTQVALFKKLLIQ